MPNEDEITDQPRTDNIERHTGTWSETSTTIAPDLMPQQMPVPPPTIAPIIPREPPGLHENSDV